jgi:hypothetical protein
VAVRTGGVCVVVALALTASCSSRDAEEADIEVARCGATIGAARNAIGDPADAAIHRLVSAFLADRAAGRRADGCLTESGLDAFDGVSLCLLSCDDGALAFDDEGPFALEGTRLGGVALTSAVVTYPHSPVREHYDLAVVGERLLISGVQAGPESSVDDAGARDLITRFLDQLAAHAFARMGALLYNEGVGARLHDEFGDAAYEPENLEPLLADYCGRAHCDAPYEIVEQIDSGEYARLYTVRFVTPTGPREETFVVSMFEGQLTVSGLPPEG